jgi:predicted nucleotidyltransferase
MGPMPIRTVSLTPELAALCRRYRVRRLELFGSAAVGEDRPGESDVDFLVEFETLPPGSYADTYFGLMEALERLLGRPVDLVVASTVRNPYFRASVERTKTLLYAA